MFTRPSNKTCRDYHYDLNINEGEISTELITNIMIHIHLYQRYDYYVSYNQNQSYIMYDSILYGVGTPFFASVPQTLLALCSADQPNQNRFS
jgi:hypothetical protein